MAVLVDCMLYATEQGSQFGSDLNFCHWANGKITIDMSHLNNKIESVLVPRGGVLTYMSYMGRSRRLAPPF